MEANKEDEQKKSKLSRFLAFICCASRCKPVDDDDDDDKKHDLVITRVYQSKSLTELAQQRNELKSPKAVRSEITADEVEKRAKAETGKNKRRFKLFRKWRGRREVKSVTPRVQGELEVDCRW